MDKTLDFLTVPDSLVNNLASVVQVFSGLLLFNHELHQTCLFNV